MANFKLFIPLVHLAEGGYQKLPTDTGNLNSLGQLVGTNKGVSAPVYETYLGYPPSEADMRAITTVTANAIYKRNYWDKLKADNMKTQEVANVLVDHGVNAGTGGAAKIVQTVLKNSFSKNLEVDGAIGNMTIAAINSVDQIKLQSAIVIAREQFYNSLAAQYPEFIRGWLNRLKPFYEDSVQMALRYKKPIGLGFLMVAIAATLLISSTNNSAN